MSGNTKLIGFGANPDRVMLRRWGESTMVEISGGSLGALQHACKHILPLKPSLKRSSALTYIEYDSLYGQVNMRMSLETAEKFAAFLRRASGVAGDFEDDCSDMRDGVEEALVEHRNYTNTDEPGVEPRAEPEVE